MRNCMSERKKMIRSEELETVTVLAVFMLLLHLYTHRQGFSHAALALLIAGLFVKPVARVISRAWLGFAGFIGTLNSKVILAIVFFLLLTPLAMIYRLFSDNPLQLGNCRDKDSLYKERNHRYNSADFEKMW